MPRYLSDEWIAALDAAASTDAGLATATRDVGLVIQQQVTGGPDGDVAWHVTLDHGHVRILPGTARHADVTFRHDHDTAQAVARGEISAQAAFMIGKLRVGGDGGLLLAHHDLFDSVEDVFASVRADTED